MREFTITGTGFVGSLTLTYYVTGKLSKMEFSEDCNLSGTQHKYVFGNVPLDVKDIDVLNVGGNTIIEVLKEITFDMFWDKYGKKEGKEAAKRAWAKLTKLEQAEAYHGINGYNKLLKKDTWRNKQDAATYLNKKTFKDYV